MIKVEGYKAFRGVMRITPKLSSIPLKDIPGAWLYKPEISGDWLYKPEYDCWYCNGSSYPANICEILEDYTG